MFNNNAQVYKRNILQQQQKQKRKGEGTAGEAKELFTVYFASDSDKGAPPAVCFIYMVYQIITISAGAVVIAQAFTTISGADLHSISLTNDPFIIQS